MNIDAWIITALELDDKDLLALCTTSKLFNDKICKQDRIWNAKLKNYDTTGFEKLGLSPRELYNLLKSLIIVKRDFGLKDTLFQLYERDKLKLNEKNIKEIPKELGNLINLEKLFLNYNQIEKIPKEIGNLSNLKELWLNINKIEKIPKEIGNLSNLKNFTCLLTK